MRYKYFILQETLFILYWRPLTSRIVILGEVKSFGNGLSV